MKTIKYILPAFAILFLIACDSDDDGFYNAKYVQAEDLVMIENPQAAYLVGDNISIHALIDNLIDEPGETTLLNIRETTGNAESIIFSYVLEKKNAVGEYEIYDITDNYFDGTSGHANSQYFVEAFADYNPAADQFQYDGGVQLTETGEYRLNFSNQTSNYNKAFLKSLSPGNNIVLNIFTTGTFDENGHYVFTVN
jgi:hypothetical protein